MIILAEDVKRDKQKGFKASQETVDKIDNLIKKSGKGPTEFFEDLVNDLAIQSVVDKDTDEISPDLRKHFESDIQKLKNATNSIISIMTSQMENISVEKNQWEALTEKKLFEKQEQINQLNEEKTKLETELEESKLQLTELTKVNQGIEKEISVLTKRTEDQEQLIQDRTEKISDLQERINKLNENIVNKDEQLKSIEPIKEELSAFKQKAEGLEQEKTRLIEQHQEELKKQKETLLFQCEKEKHKLETALKEAFIQEKENLRDEVRKSTEDRIREFYLDEIKRKDAEAKLKEEEIRNEVKKETEERIRSLYLEREEELKKEIAQLKQQKPQPKKTTSTRTKKENE